MFHLRDKFSGVKLECRSLVMVADVPTLVPAGAADTLTAVEYRENRRRGSRDGVMCDSTVADSHSELIAFKFRSSGARLTVGITRVDGFQWGAVNSMTGRLSSSHGVVT